MTLHAVEAELQCVADQCAQLLGHDRFFIQIGEDFQDYHRILEWERSNQRIGQPFHPQTLNNENTRALWLTARSAEGVLLHTQAIKELALKGFSLADYLGKHFLDFPPPWSDVDKGRSTFHETPGTKRISGVASYHGEFWSHRSMRSTAGQSTSYTFGQLANHLAYFTANPDWMFGFILSGVYRHGFAARLEYLNLEPRCLRWFRYGSQSVAEAGIVYSSRSDLRFVRKLHKKRVCQQAFV